MLLRILHRCGVRRSRRGTAGAGFVGTEAGQRIGRHHSPKQRRADRDVEIAAKNGSFTEPPEYNGLSHLYEHMFYKADSVLPSQQYFLQRVGELGAIWNGRTETERVFYYFTLPSYNLDPGLKFLSDCIRKPLFDSVELEKERHVVIGEIDRNESLPFFKFQNALDDSLWWKYPSRKNPLGDRATGAFPPRAQRCISSRISIISPTTPRLSSAAT